MSAAIKIIEDEHRSIAAVLQALTWLTAEIGAARMTPDFALLEATLRYIAAFPEKLHHPKEDQHIYARLRKLRPDAGALIDELETEHVRGRAYIVELASALNRYRNAGSVGLPAFDAAVRTYAEFQWQHMRKEEEIALPLALKTLTAEDWKVIDAAFLSNDDPLVGFEAGKETRALFSRIVNLAPPPIGVGPARG
jgi:hemerythrin-like domain-containing protein